MASRKSSSASARAPKRPPANGLLAFLGQVIKNYRYTGAILPSSSILGRTMTRTLRQDPRPKRLLEVGPGTGPFTKFMLRALRPGDELHIVEINPAFARRLEDAMLAPYRASHPRTTVKLYCESIETAPPASEGAFDYIVCSLPFNNFPPDLVRAMFRRLLDLLKPGGELAYFEYAGVRVMKGSVVDKVGRRKLKQIHLMGKVLSRRHKGRRELVLGNMPPAVAVRLSKA
jgi:phospholipid N-methyltransferase